MMSDEEAIDGPATLAAAKTPLEDAPALKDPAAERPLREGSSHTRS